jgi:hypothetical protein
MKKLFKLTILTSSMGILLTGCFIKRTEPLYNVQNNPITEEEIGTGIYSEVYRAIKEAGLSTNWKIRKIKEGEAQGKLSDKKHPATIKITYNNKFYSINYVKSKNFKYNSSENTIHKNYNKWVQRLENKINKNLSILKSH